MKQKDLVKFQFKKEVITIKKSKLIIICLVMIFTIVGCGVNNVKQSKESSNNKHQLTEEEKLEDFEYMYTLLKENYPFFEVNKRLNGVDWLNNKDEYINWIKATSDDKSFFDTLDKILSELHNGHTLMLNKPFYLELKNYYEKYSYERESWVQQVNKPKTVERYSAMKENENTVASAQNTNNKNVVTKDLEEGKIAYISIASLNDLNVEEDFKTINPYLEHIKNYKDLIIDIRGNGGGTDVYWKNIVKRLINKPLEYTYYMAFRGGAFDEQFLKDAYGYGYEKLEPISNIDKENLKKLPPEVKTDFKYYKKFPDKIEPKNPVDFKGKIYLLVDGANFSASEQFANFAKSTGFATLVGEATGGDGIGFEPGICELPNSGYLVRFPEEMGLNPDGTCDFETKTEPDITVHEEPLNTVVKLINKG